MSDERRRQSALTPEEDERVRLALRAFVKTFDTQKAASERLGFSQQTVSRVTKGFPAGRALAERVAECVGTTFEELIGRGTHAVAEPDRPTLGALPGWNEMEARARRRYPHIPDEAWELVRDSGGAAVPLHLTTEIIGQLASVYAMALRGEGEDVDPD